MDLRDFYCTYLLPKFGHNSRSSIVLSGNTWIELTFTCVPVSLRRKPNQKETVKLHSTGCRCPYGGILNEKVAHVMESNWNTAFNYGGDNQAHLM